MWCCQEAKHRLCILYNDNLLSLQFESVLSIVFVYVSYLIQPLYVLTKSLLYLNSCVHSNNYYYEYEKLTKFPELPMSFPY